jgi:hypothetical protein
MPRPENVVLLDNGTVQVYGEDGARDVNLEGKLAAVGRAVLDAAPAHCKFEVSVWNWGRLPSSRGAFESFVESIEASTKAATDALRKSIEEKA